MPVRAVLIAWLAGAVACMFSGVVMAASGVEPAVTIIGSVVFGVAVLFATALLIDAITRD